MDALQEPFARQITPLIHVKPHKLLDQAMASTMTATMAMMVVMMTADVGSSSQRLSAECLGRAGLRRSVIRNKTTTERLNRAANANMAVRGAPDAAGAALSAPSNAGVASGARCRGADRRRR